ncbi:PSMD9 [Acanthosepion pharaonis]|uniref:26S proteasome non-ATPase regulatory subunit 9 n=1 Tax=Acanthosepion pharaonis TaxID=158019 RepID=A0A812AXW9_ACAPH|nr:PSMD9 [Sepia pharaonis]
MRLQQERKASRPKSKMEELVMRKEDIEREITELSALLEQQCGVGMSGPLLDNEGYPRSDIDVYSVRHARHRIKCLQTDHTQVMKEIEEKLLRIHAEVRDSKNNNTEAISRQPRLPPRVLPAFAKVDKVEPGSPASKANLQIGDEILRFGSIQHKNFENLQDVGKVVQYSIGKTISVSVLRDGKEIRLTLIPNKWSGRGLLGRSRFSSQVPPSSSQVPLPFSLSLLLLSLSSSFSFLSSLSLSLLFYLSLSLLLLYLSLSPPPPFSLSLSLLSSPRFTSLSLSSPRFTSLSLSSPRFTSSLSSPPLPPPFTSLSSQNFYG